jgi:UDPglucose 6-dehydrogenase
MLGNEVIFHDINNEKLALLKGQGYKVTEDILEAIKDSNVSFICVQTPLVDGEFDFSYLRKAAIDVARALREKDEYHVVVVRSTVLPSSTRTKIIPILEEHSELKAGKDFGVCMNPEFLRQTTALQDFLNPHRIVIGELDKKSGDPLELLYSPYNVPIFRTDLETAEMIKYVANCFLATKISFFNEIYIICRELGFNPHFISEIVALDPRIGKYGIYGGRPFGGDCLPKDLRALISFVETKKLNPKLLTAALHINKNMAEMCSKGEIRD